MFWHQYQFKIRTTCDPTLVPLEEWVLRRQTRPTEGQKMKGARFKEEQIVAILNQVDRGVPIKEVCRQHGIVQGTIYRWKAKYGGMQVSDAKKLRSLEAENSRLKRMVADMALDIQVLKDVNSKKW